MAKKKIAKKKTAKKTVKRMAKKAAKKAVKKTAKKVVRKTVKKATKKAIKKPLAPARTITKRKTKVKSFLSKKQLAEFRRLLLEKRKSLLDDMSGIEAGALGRNLQESAGDLSNMPTHPADIGSDNFEHEFTLGLLESERALLGEINESLERIDQGIYGICLGTGDPIGKSRLTARPWCKYCIEYQKMIEKGLVRPGEDDAFGPDEDED